MNFRRIAWATLTVMITVATSDPTEDAVRVYPAPAGEVLATNFVVTVGRKAVPVYLAKVAAADPVRRFKAMDEKAASAYFDLQGRAEVSVTWTGVVQQAKVLPSSSGIVPAVRGNRITFTINQP